MADLMMGGGTVEPWGEECRERSPEFQKFAEDVAARLPENPDFSDEWLDELVTSFVQYTD